MSDLFSPLQLGSYHLQNRICMAPLTRSRAPDAGVPTASMAKYYALRAGAGLIISEATNISPQGRGYAYTPGIFSQAQIDGWRGVTAAVHAAGGRIFCQLWHVGRVSHPDLQAGKVLPVAPSAIKPHTQIFTESGMVSAQTPHALTLSEIQAILVDYRIAAENAITAGFDGVEIHAANGYLIDQFLRDGSNIRTDAYGGCVENRIRFACEVVETVSAAIGADKVGIRISPLSSVNDMSDSAPEAVFTALVAALNPFGLAYLHVVEGVTRGPREVTGGFDLQKLRRLFTGLYMGNNGYTRELAMARLARNEVDLVAFGRPFIANPDLVSRLKLNLPLALPDQTTFYGGDDRGYLDYPFADSPVL